MVYSVFHIVKFSIVPNVFMDLINFRILLSKSVKHLAGQYMESFLSVPSVYIYTVHYLYTGHLGKINLTVYYPAIGFSSVSQDVCVCCVGQSLWMKSMIKIHTSLFKEGKGPRDYWFYFCSSTDSSPAYFRCDGIIGEKMWLDSFVAIVSSSKEVSQPGQTKARARGHGRL